MKTKQQMLALVEDLIRSEGRPLNVNEIIRLADTRLPTKSRTPQNVVHKHLSLEVKKNRVTKFVKVAPGTYGIRED